MVSYKWYLSGPRVLGFGIRAVSKVVGGRLLASNGDVSCLRHQGHSSTGGCPWPLPAHSSSGDMSASHVPLLLYKLPQGVGLFRSEDGKEKVRI